jgi:hypothetical protein
MRHTIHNVQRSYIKVQKPFFSYHPSKGGGDFCTVQQIAHYFSYS